MSYQDFLHCRKRVNPLAAGASGDLDTQNRNPSCAHWNRNAFQVSALFDSETVLGNVMFPLEALQPTFQRGTTRTRSLSVSREWDLRTLTTSIPSGDIRRYAETYVAIARAIALNPKYLFAMSPTQDLIREPQFLLTNC